MPELAGRRLPDMKSTPAVSVWMVGVGPHWHVAMCSMRREVEERKASDVGERPRVNPRRVDLERARFHKK